MYYNDHGPPHFHVRYAGVDAKVFLEPMGECTGNLPPRVRGLVIEWAKLHRQELLENWTRAREHDPERPLVPIAPME